MDKLGYVWAAYTIAWILIFGYTVLLGGRQSRIETELTLLQEAIDKREE